MEEGSKGNLKLFFRVLESLRKEVIKYEVNKK